MNRAGRALRAPLILTIALATAAGFAAEPAREHVRVVVQAVIPAAPIFFAEQDGLFAAQGLDVELVEMARTDAAVPPLLQSEVDVLSGTVRPSLLNAIARGGRLRIVADRGHSEAGGCTVFGILGPAAGPARLAGAKIASAPGAMQDLFLDRYLNRKGGALDQVELVNLPAAPAMEALGRGTLDLVVAGEPELSKAVGSGRFRLLAKVEDEVPGFQFAVVTFGPSLLDARPEVGRRFMAAYLSGVRRYAEGPTPRNLAALAPRVGVTAEVLKQACWPPIRPDGDVQPRSVLDYQAWAKKRGLVDRELAWSELWDGRFAQAAAPGSTRR